MMCASWIRFRASLIKTTGWQANLEKRERDESASVVIALSLVAHGLPENRAYFSGSCAS